MFDEVIVPLDGSEESARALRPASAIAHYLDIKMSVVAFHPSINDGHLLSEAVCEQVDTIGVVDRDIRVTPIGQSIPEALISVLAQYPHPLVVMATRGHGRTAALVGSVANQVLAQTGAPVLLIGPACDISRFRLHGPMIVAADSSDHSQDVIELAATMTTAFDFIPSVVNVLDPSTSQKLNKARSGGGGHDVPDDSMLAHRYAIDLGEASGRRDIDYRVLHDRDPASAIVKQAIDTDATLITMATRARSGIKRLALGSVAASVIGHAPCPVLAVAPG